MKYKNLMTGVAVSLFCTAVLGGCSSDTSTDDTTNTPETSYWESQETDIFAGNAFQTVATSDSMELQLNPKTATLRWLDTESGLYKDTNLSADSYVGSNNTKSDVIVNYYNGTDTKLYQTSAMYDSYSMGAMNNQVSYQKMENGIRVIYALGEDSITYKNFPLNISGERMEEFVLQYLDSKQIELLTKNYYTKMADGTYHRKSNEDALLGSMAAKELYNYFYETGTYTEEELYADLDSDPKVKDEDYPSNLMIRFAVEYTIEGNELVVNMDTSKIETDEDNPIRDIQLLPYFLTSSTTETEEEGYMFIPDGSGALIYLDSTKRSETNYTAHFYRDDKLVDATTYYSIVPELTMPVIGMKTSDKTILGIIENGAEVANLNAYVSMKDNSEPFSKMKLTFDICEQQVMTTETNNAFKVYKVSDDIYDGLITLRYFWLDADADYVDMANCYAEYLVEKGTLTEKEADAEAPFYVEVLGVTDKTQYFLGIPYEGKQVLTSFDEAKSILTDLNDAGVKNIKMIYSGMLNGGMNQRGMADGVKFGSDLGGSKDFKSLVSYAESIGAEIYPNLQLQSLYTKKGIDSGDIAFNIVNARAQLYVFDPVLQKVDDKVDYSEYIVSPNYFAEYLDGIKSSYSKKIGLDTVASSDLMTYFGTNYRGTHVSPGTAEDIYNEAAAAFADGMSLMLSDPIVDGYAYGSILTDIPGTDSTSRVLDASVPFKQIVLDGYKTYSSESLNLESTDIQAEFMKAIETKSAPKFTFTYRDSSLLAGTTQNDLFAIDYNYWKESIGTYYAEYQEFYEAVKDAVIEEHELYERDEDLRIVTYSNGVKVYFNYSDQEEKIDGVKVPAFSYQIVK